MATIKTIRTAEGCYEFALEQPTEELVKALKRFTPTPYTVMPVQPSDTNYRTTFSYQFAPDFEREEHSD